MTTTLWLRISSIIALLLAAGHTAGGLKSWSPMGDNPVLQAMRSARFSIMGVDRSYYDFYMGFGHALSVAQVMLAGLLWQLGSLAGTNSAGVRPLIAVIVLATIASCVIVWRFILPVPALFSLALAVSLTVALVVALRQPAVP